MIARTAWIALMLALAVVVSFVQLDRASRTSPQLAVLVPPALSGFALEQRIKLAIAQQNTDSAAGQARALVRTRPVQAEHMTLLSITAALRGDEEQAIAALEAASVRGWREPLAQAATAEAALSSGAPDAAAQRIAALLATGELRDNALDLLGRLLEARAGRVAFAEQMAAEGHWQKGALGVVAAVAEPNKAAETLAMAQARGAQLACPQLANLARNYRRQGFVAEAALFWPGDCPNG